MTQSPQSPRPRTLRQIVFHYAQKMQSLREETTFLDLVNGLERASAKAEQEYQTSLETGAALERRRLAWERLLNKKRLCEERLLRRVRQLASKGHWLAIGRCGPDTNPQLIRLRHWSFLKFDEAENAACGDGLEYRELRCWLTKELPTTNSLRQAIEQDLISLRTSTASLAQSSDQPAPRDGGAGRPSNFHLLERMHRERRQKGIAKERRLEEANELLQQFKTMYPNIQPPQVKTITNRLSKLRREEISRRVVVPEL